MLRDAQLVDPLSAADSAVAGARQRCAPEDAAQGKCVGRGYGGRLGLPAATRFNWWRAELAAG